MSLTELKKRKYFGSILLVIVPISIVVSILQFWFHLFSLPLWVYGIVFLVVIGTILEESKT